ncbi:hypothetical protein GCM10010320_69030 [Streptomyces caelestis]|nr:hypothetical protein GCM10010320_69030 [Streptomyces caelestis]
MALRMKVSAITLDCPDPLAPAAFYQAATGLAPHPRSNAEFASLGGGDGISLGFQRVDDYRAPSWPDQDVPQQLHCCFRVADLEEAEARLLELGAARPERQPNETRWRVLTDPAGHPFCIRLVHPVPAPAESARVVGPPYGACRGGPVTFSRAAARPCGPQFLTASAIRRAAWAGVRSVVSTTSASLCSQVRAASA